MIPARPAHRALFACVAALAAAAPASAQYKVVGPDGSVTYTDRPPASTTHKVTPMSRQSAAALPAAESGLPFELQQAASRFPVTLYAQAECSACDAARSLLQQRGVPYTEKRIVSDDDVLALERIVGGRTVPSVTIGQQALRGLSPGEWDSYLDAAGYPRESRLPRSWQAPAPAPLVGAKPAAPTARANARTPAPAPDPLPEPPPADISGIRF